jgi:DNA-binding response OmpR family regulator
MNKQILLVEDDAGLRATLRTCLEMAGYTCIEAKDGQDARGKLENDSPDLIVTDHQMPRVTGLELIKGLKSQKTQKQYQLYFIVVN